MTEPPRPPGEGNPYDPTTPFNPYAANDPTSGSTPPPPPGPPSYAPPPYDTQSGYSAPPPGYGMPQPGYSITPDDKTAILIAHFGGAAGAFFGGGLAGWIVPLIVMLAKGTQSPAVRAESVKALNFQIVWSLVTLVGWITLCLGIGVVIIAIAAIIAIVFGVVAGVKANNGEQYNYPMTYPIIK
ncbi:MAG: DUF4870 domain-containing protein [Actinoplanes sp.]